MIYVKISITILIILKACWEAVIGLKKVWPNTRKSKDADLLTCHENEKVEAYVHIYTYTCVHTPKHIIGKGLFKLKDLICYVWFLYLHLSK